MPPGRGNQKAPPARVTEAPALPVLSDGLLAATARPNRKGYASFSAWWNRQQETMAPR